MQRAQVLGVTLSKATINSLIYERKFDLIIIDEASMAYVPHVLFASSLGKRIVICGDFRQLPPIAQANDELVKKRLAVDIFKVTGIIKAVEKQQPVENLVMLDIQRRMHPKISRFSNHHFYDGRLKDHSSVIGREQIAQLEPYPGDAVALFDTTLCNTLTSKEFASRSKFNVLSAFIAIQLMGQARNSGIKEIGYICPYNAQSRLVSVLAQELLSEMQESNILCATVHKFQGSEREAIFYDTVDSYPQKMAGILHRSEDTGRLVNVALTRSKGKFVQISNQRYIKERLPKDNFTAQLVQYSGKWSSTTALKEIQSQLSRYKLKGLSWYFQDYMPELLRHIREAKSEIVICIPDGAHLDRAIWQALKELKRTVNKTIYSKNFSYSSAESHWDVIHWNHYLPLLVIDQAWIWYGVTTQDVVSCRVHAPKTARMLFGFLRLNLAKQSRAEIAATTMSIKPDLRLRDYVQNRSTCYVCGSRVLLKLSSKGKIYYQCDHCQSGGGIPLDVLDKYLTEVHLRCSKCKGNIEARLSKYGVYAKCSSCEETIDVRALW